MEVRRMDNGCSSGDNADIYNKTLKKDEFFYRPSSFLPHLMFT